MLEQIWFALVFNSVCQQLSYHLQIYLFDKNRSENFFLITIVKNFFNFDKNCLEKSLFCFWTTEFIAAPNWQQRVRRTHRRASYCHVTIFWVSFSWTWATNQIVQLHPRIWSNEPNQTPRANTRDETAELSQCQWRAATTAKIPLRVILLSCHLTPEIHWENLKSQWRTKMHNFDSSHWLQICPLKIVRFQFQLCHSIEWKWNFPLPII